MSISLFSFLMSVMFSTVFILGIHVLRNRPFFLKSFEVHTLLTLYGLCLFRMVVVIELPFTIPVGLRGAFSRVYDRVRQFQMPVGKEDIELTAFLCCIWAVVAGVLFTRFIWRDHAVKKELALCHRNENKDAERALSKAMAVSSRKLPVNVCVCGSIDIPMGLGLFHKWIYLPDEKFAKEELYYIMMHEYTHFCNRDGVVKLLTMLFCCVFWWNPAVYILKKDVSQILEIKCDVYATQSFTKKERLEYLLTILRVLKGNPAPGNSPSPLTATGLISRTKGDNTKERFELIMKAAKQVEWKYQVALLSCSVVLTVLSYAFVLQPAFDPPVEDIFTDKSTVEWDSEDVYILQHSDMTYSLVLGNGEKCPISDPVLQMYVDLGTEIRKE